MNYKKRHNYLVFQVAKPLLEKAGYSVYCVKSYAIKTKRGWRSKGEDIFGADIIAVSKNDVRFIQVTTNKDLKKRVKKFNCYNFPVNEACKAEVWLAKKIKGNWIFKKGIYSKAKQKIIFDKGLTSKTKSDII